MQILTGIAVSGLFVTLFMGQSPSLSGDTGPANASIAGYSMIMGSLICLWFTSFYLVNKETMTNSIINASHSYFSFCSRSFIT
jgi:hypothetical protein